MDPAGARGENMELPKFNETFMPILEVLNDGKIITGRELLELVEKKFYSSLPEELLNQTIKNGGRLIENRIAWGKSYLKKGGLVHYPQRGYVQITEKGKSAIKEKVSIEQMEANVIDFYKPETQKVDTDLRTSSPQDLIDSGIEQIENHTKSELLDKLKNFDPYAFEKVVLILLNNIFIKLMVYFWKL